MPRPPQLQSHKSYDAELTALFALFDSKPEGNLFTYTQVEEVTALQQNVSPWQTVLSKFRKLYLQQRGTAIRCERGVGYRTLTPQQQLENDDHRRRGLKAIQRDFNEKVFLKDEKLTDEQRKLQMALGHQDTVDIRQIKAHQAERKSFLASPAGISAYLISNQLRPRATLVEEEEDDKE